MRRALASFLLAAISLPLIAPAIFADADASLPACCRRDGKHHCAMTQEAPAPLSGTSMQAVGARCPLYPAVSTTPAGDLVAVLHGPLVIFGTPAGHPAISDQTPIRDCRGFNRSRQQRGPPVAA